MVATNVSPAHRAKQLARGLSGLLPAVSLDDDHDQRNTWREELGVDDPHISDAVLTELRSLVQRNPQFQYPRAVGSRPSLG